MEEQTIQEQTKDYKNSLKEKPRVKASGPIYQKMPFGFNGCKVSFGTLFKNVNEGDMVTKAMASKSLGFTFQSSLKYGYLMTAAGMPF